MTNIHGLKQSHTAMEQMLKREHKKPRENQSKRKIERLERAKRNCADTIRKLKAQKPTTKRAFSRKNRKTTLAKL